MHTASCEVCTDLTVQWSVTDSNGHEVDWILYNIRTVRTVAYAYNSTLIDNITIPLIPEELNNVTFLIVHCKASPERSQNPNDYRVESAVLQLLDSTQNLQAVTGKFFNPAHVYVKMS